MYILLQFSSLIFIIKQRLHIDIWCIISKVIHCLKHIYKNISLSIISVIYMLTNTNTANVNCERLDIRARVRYTDLWHPSIQYSQYPVSNIQYTSIPVYQYSSIPDPSIPVSQYPNILVYAVCYAPALTL